MAADTLTDELVILLLAQANIADAACQAGRLPALGSRLDISAKSKQHKPFTSYPTYKPE